MRRFALLFAALLGVAVPAGPAAAAPGGAAAPEYYLGQWRVPQLWATGADGRGVTIAEIDTGVDAGNGVLGGRVLAGVDFGRLGGSGRIDRDRDRYGHGTSMASIMVGRPGPLGIEGLAPAARLLPIAIPLTGTTEAAADDRLPEAIRWAADHGAKIISMSLGGARRPTQFRTACPGDEQEAIFAALRKGALVLAASGNGGSEGSPVEEPSVCLGVVSVGAVDAGGAVADFSSRHRYLTLTAPGVDVPSIGPGGTPFAGDGTSQATAVAAAAVALVWSRYPSLTSSEVLARILATTDRHRDRPDRAYGYGVVNPYRAITTSVPRSAPDPVYALARPFLRRDEPAAPLLPPRPAMRRAAEPPGQFSVGAAPSEWPSRTVTGAVVAAAGLVLLIALAIGGRIATRRRRSVVCSDDSGRLELSTDPGTNH